MSDTALIEVPAAEAGRTPLSWSAAIAGAFAATAVTLIIVALGSGIGLSFASPYGSGPSATSLTIAAAVWLVMAQTMGFATGGYLAGCAVRLSMGYRARRRFATRRRASWSGRSAWSLLPPSPV